MKNKMLKKNFLKPLEILKYQTQSLFDSRTTKTKCFKATNILGKKNNKQTNKKTFLAALGSLMTLKLGQGDQHWYL